MHFVPSAKTKSSSRKSRECKEKAGGSFQRRKKLRGIGPREWHVHCLLHALHLGTTAADASLLR